MLTDLKNRGLQDIFIACCDGLKGFPQAIETVYPHTQIQLCVVHLIRNSLRYVAWKNSRALTADLKLIDRAATLEEAEAALEAFADKWDPKYPAVSQIGLRHWENIIPIFDYPNTKIQTLSCRTTIQIHHTNIRIQQIAHPYSKAPAKSSSSTAEIPSSSMLIGSSAQMP